MNIKRAIIVIIIAAWAGFAIATAGNYIDDYRAFQGDPYVG